MLVTVRLAVAVQPAGVVTVTVYVPVVLTVMLAVVAALLHKYVPAGVELAVNVNDGVAMALIVIEATATPQFAVVTVAL